MHSSRDGLRTVTKRSLNSSLYIPAHGVYARPCDRAPAGKLKGAAREGTSPTQVCSSPSGLISRCLFRRQTQRSRSIGTFKFALDAGVSRRCQLSHFVKRIANMALRRTQEAAFSAHARVRQCGPSFEFVRISSPTYGSFWEGADLDHRLLLYYAYSETGRSLSSSVFGVQRSLMIF